LSREGATPGAINGQRQFSAQTARRVWMVLSNDPTAMPCPLRKILTQFRNHPF